MTFRRFRFGRLAAAGLALTLTLAGYAGLQLATGAPANAATSQFHGVNWADPNDNFITSPNIPVGLSTSDSYATVYAKATAVLKGFQGLGANTVRFGINTWTTSSSWWNSLVGAYDAASALGMNVIIAPWLQGGKISDTNAFYTMWDTVINKYGNSSNFYFDIMNEPYAYSATDLTNAEAAWVSRYQRVSRSRMIVPGLWSDQNLCSVGADSRLSGTLLSLHIYGMFGDSHTTEAAWVTDLNNNLCGYASRTVITEFGVPMNTGVNYNGPHDGNNDLSYLYAVTDTARSQGIGTVLWTGVKEANQTSGPGPCENASCAITSLNGSGTNLSLSITNRSGLDRLQYGWGTSPSSSPPITTGSSAPASSRPPVTTSPTAPSSSRPPATGGCSAAYTTVNSWPGGFQGQVTVTAGSSAISGWTAQWTLGSGQSVSQVWSGTLTTSGSTVKVSNASYNGSLAAGASTTFGFIGTGTVSTPAVSCTSS